jgi:hypothetical protein
MFKEKYNNKSRNHCKSIFEQVEMLVHIIKEKYPENDGCQSSGKYG